jgi:hypothetical protein
LKKGPGVIAGLFLKACLVAAPFVHAIRVVREFLE